MRTIKTAYVPIGVGTFHLPSAQDLFDRSVAVLSAIAEKRGCELVCPEKMLLSVPDLESYLGTIDPDLIVLQNITFANAAYTQTLMRRFADRAVLLWTLPEPVIDGGRLRLNSLTGAFSAGNTMRGYGKNDFVYMLGTPEADAVQKTIFDTMAAVQLRESLKELKLAQVGHTPQGFGFGRALDMDMLRVFGVTLESVEVRELIKLAKSYSDEDAAADLEDAKKYLVGLENTPEQNVRDFARLYKAYRAYVTDNGIKALASRCWPDLFVEYGTPVCAVLSLLNAEGVVASCESDAYGALSMYIGAELSGESVFFGDPVSVSEEENSLTFWHCGMAPCNLAREDTGACVGVHPNRKIGPTMEFGCKPGDKATVFRVGRTPEGKFRLFIAGGDVMDKPRQFLGTSIVVHMEHNAKETVLKAVEAGWEPHFVVTYGDIRGELTILAKMLGIEVEAF